MCARRRYSYYDVIKWFAPRCDMILLMFDANKIDISDELKQVSTHRRRFSSVGLRSSHEIDRQSFSGVGYRTSRGL